MGKKAKIETWIVKDTDGHYVTVEADSWEVGGNGLLFFRDGVRVANFIRWAYYVKVKTA